MQTSGFWAGQAPTTSAGTLFVAAIANVTGFLFDSMLSLGLTTGILIANPLQIAPVWYSFSLENSGASESNSVFMHSHGS